MKTAFRGFFGSYKIKSILHGPFTLVLAIALQTLNYSISFSPSAWAALPTLQFDVKHRVACVDVQETTRFKAEEGERLVQARIPVSTLVQDGLAQGLVQLLIRFENPDRSLHVIDYQPKTTLATDIVGHIGIETKQDKSSGVGLTLSGEQVGIQGTTRVDLGSKSGKCVKWQHLPPLELLSASGTIARGSGVYFKLRPSKRTSLEGNRDFVLLFRVPQGWQAGILHVDCLALGKQRSMITNGEETLACGHNRFVVALYASGNKLAQRQAERLVAADARLQQLAQVHQQQILDRAYPYPGYRVAAFFHAVEPHIPGRWLETILFHVPGSAEPLKETPLEFWSELPDPVQDAARKYLQAKRQIQLAAGRAQRE